jgi:hypothetical protein
MLGQYSLSMKAYIRASFTTALLNGFRQAQDASWATG